MLALQEGAHRANELARRVRPGFQSIGDPPGGLVADPQVVFVDQRVVNPVDVEVAQPTVVQARAQPVLGDVVAESQGLEEVLVHDVGSGAHDRVDHAASDHLGKNLLEPGAHERAREAQNDAAFAVAEHAVEDVRRAGEVAGHKRHPPHGVDPRDDVDCRDVDVLDCFSEKLSFFRHPQSPCSK